MSKNFKEMFSELKEFVEQNKCMPKPQKRSNRDEMLLGLWVFRTLQGGNPEEERQIRELAKDIPGPCPKSYATRLEEYLEFCKKNSRIPEKNGNEGEKSLYNFGRKHRDKAEIKKICEIYKEKEGI